MSKWHIDQKALDQVREHLGIEFPVRVRTTDLGWASGKYHGLGKRGPTTEEILPEPTHHISLSNQLGGEMANTVLWHELTHAAQCEDYLPEDGDYAVANAGLRQAFGREMREIRTTRNIGQHKGITADYGDVSFEVEAREHMNKKDKIVMVKGDTSETVKDEDDPLKGYKHLWRVDMWDDKKKWVGTTYVFANTDYDARKWARDNHMKGMKWSSNVNAYPIHPRG